MKNVGESIYRSLELIESQPQFSVPHGLCIPLGMTAIVLKLLKLRLV
jgi:hypothetical protein